MSFSSRLKVSFLNVSKQAVPEVHCPLQLPQAGFCFHREHLRCPAGMMASYHFVLVRVDLRYHLIFQWQGHKVATIGKS